MSEKVLKAPCGNLQVLKGTMKVHTVFSLKANSIMAHDMSCLKFQKDLCCKGQVGENFY